MQKYLTTAINISMLLNEQAVYGKGTCIEKILLNDRK